MIEPLAWWVWVTLGILLITSELIANAFVLLWFGIGAVLVGLTTLVAPELNAGVQFALAAIWGVVLLAVFRKRCVAKKNGEAEDTYTFTAGPGRLSVAADGRVSVFARGTYWSIANLEAIPEAARRDGLEVVIDRFEGNLAVVREQGRLVS